MKILIVCRAGVVRSVALAKILRELFGHDAIPISGRFNSPETLSMLSAWADKIFVVEPDYVFHLPEYIRPNVELIDLGPDIFHDSTDPALIWRIYSALSKRKDLFNV